MNAKRPPDPARIQPPMVPMIALMFNLLLFFILTPSVAQSDGYLTTNLPDVGPNGPRGDGIIYPIRIDLCDEGPRGEGVAIVLNGNMDLGANFDGLRDGLIELRGRGIAAGAPVLIAPTMACRHKWVVDAFDAAVAARFTKVNFAVPYE